MATIQKRPFSKDYSGLITQSVLAVGLFAISISFHEYAKRKRRGKNPPKGLGNVESWQFGYLYQARTWAKKSSPPISQGWPLSWVRQAVTFPDDKLNEIRGVDASLYVRFLKGCVRFTLLHMFTTFPILFSIHVTFSDDSVSPKSMTRASISSLVGTVKGAGLLWIHLLLLIWITFSWFGTLHWIIRGTFELRAAKIREAAAHAASQHQAEKDAQYHPHPHPQYPFQALPTLDHDHSTRGLRARTVMVTNIPPGLRSETELKEYFEYYMSRPLAKPTIGVTSAVQPGFVDRSAAFLLNKCMRFSARALRMRSKSVSDGGEDVTAEVKHTSHEVPVIDRVILVRKMTELASLLERREEVLKNIETAHVKLARNALQAADDAIKAKVKLTTIRNVASRISFGLVSRVTPISSLDLERTASTDEASAEGEDRMHLLVRTLSPYLREKPPAKGLMGWIRYKVRLPQVSTEGSDPRCKTNSGLRQKARCGPTNMTIWEALLSLPRSTLDTYQPLIHLSALFRGKTVPAIDYYTAKLNILTGLITEERSLPPASFRPMSTAFVTFADPTDARRACKYLPVHPNNPVNACLVTMAPSYEDLDWTRLMKSTYRAEFVKDWVVNIGVWGFTIFWVFPVTSIVGLVSIQNISAFWPGLKNYLDHHEWQSEVLQSFVPTLLVALLALLIPLLLLLIAKKAHTILTLSALHDRILTRYYKFLIVNVLVFFCVGTAALQSFLVSFKSVAGEQLLQVVADSFPTAGPFYVGWLIFTMGIHGGLELALFGLPLILYPSTKRQVTPRKRAVGIRPRTYNFYYWLPNHLLVVHILLLFAVLNPLVLPFGLMYFCVEFVIIKNQLLHVYAKNYEGNGQALLIRMIRYSLDGLILAQAVFLAYMVVLKIKANVGVSAVLIVLTVFMKISLTRFCRAKFERDDLTEAQILCGMTVVNDSPLVADDPSFGSESPPEKGGSSGPRSRLGHWTWKLSNRLGASYRTVIRPHRDNHRNPLPFSRASADSTIPLEPCASTAGLITKDTTDTSNVAQLTKEPLYESPTEDDESPRPYHDTGSMLVVSHPAHPVWDDDSNPDTPYDNPYYTRPISDTLWLPRDPLGILNLDDTIDLRMSLTSEPGAGKLGAWQEDEFLSSAIESALATSFGSVDVDSISLRTSRHLEHPDAEALPVGTTSYPEFGQRPLEQPVGHTSSVRPSLLSPRRPSNISVGRERSLSPRRPAPLRDMPSSSAYRSFSLGAESFASSGRPTPSHLSVPSIGRNRSSSVDAASVGPHSMAHSYFTPGASGLRSVIRAPGVRTPSSLASPGAGSIISVRETVVSEAIAEEHLAAQARQRQEQADEEKAKEPRSWLTSWLYSRGQ
ncbi:hypothetical protein PHLGIDRAFT_108550 [Phlebiopsis gigantea 11061_1 CR5-6]|uniref:CSC1/OSCA1-like 7TM region domain-containing protein n=1 Tax=Phlebiopsis gigantea (strain 11061_1 CR5-6) TaxID=745531 RepID=A0A0C3NJN8_PHLG1|nr:hypothetical protein PHLGIDRAFT_108550 [Phlebiopsis gigantea 11061_1 CR5-6]